MASHKTDVIDASGESRFQDLRFAPDVERLYQIHRAQTNHREVAVTFCLALVLWNICLIGDFFAAREYFHLFFVGRSLIVTPVSLLLIVVLWHRSRQYDFWSMMTVTCGVAVTAGVLMMADGSFRYPYFFGLILYMMIGCTMVRPRTHQAILAMSLQFLICLALVKTTTIVPPSEQPFMVVLCAVGAIVPVLSTYAAERVSRRSFLMGLRIERLNQELAIESTTDSLTNLANRRHFEQVTTRHWNDPSVRTDPVSIVLIDVDHFKLFNDSYGHSAGDVCLMKVARCVTAGISKEGGGLAVRFGGEEMLMFLPSTDFTQARQIADHVRRAILHEAVPHAAEDPDRVVSASFGVATATTASCDVVELVKRADTALYAAKRSGRNQVWPPIADAAEESARTSDLVQMRACSV